MKTFRHTAVTRAVIATLCGTATMLVSQETFAQQSGQSLQRVEVTGSNIKRTDTETASPVQVINRQDIERTGKQTLAEVLQDLPFNNNGSVPTTFGNGFAAGGSGVSLRGLSVNSTLVLLNGRRIAPYGLADDGQRTFADLSSIPLDLVDRVEILKDGASAIYGSDALAGVVNIILRKEYNGLAISGAAGTSRYRDANEQRLTVTKGWNSDAFNAYLNVEYTHQDSVSMLDRAGKRSFIGVGDTTPFGFDLLNSGLSMIRGYKLSGPSVSASPTGWAIQVAGPNSTSRVGSYAQLGGGTACVPGKTTGIAPINANPACLWNVYDWVDIKPEEDKLNVFGRATMRLSGDNEVYAEAGIFRSKVSTHYTPSSVSSVWVGGNGNIMDNTFITMGPAHPDNPFPGNNARLRYVTADLGGRNNNYDTQVSRFLVGLKGTVSSWDYDTGLLYTESKTDIERSGYIRNAALRGLLNGTYPGMVGQYYRLGVNAGLNSQAVRDAVSPAMNNSTKTSVTSLDFKASRELGKLAGGALAIAVGADVRQEKLNSPPTPGTATGDVVGLGYSAFNQTRNVWAVYGEIVAPVTKSLELSAAARHDRYSDWGSVTTPKIGAKWQAMSALALRGSYAQGFRAPGAAESGNSSVAAFTSYVDPVRCPGGTALPGAVASRDCGAGQTSVFSIGNPGIQPEKSQSWNFGFVLEPNRNINAAVDFWQITRKNEIIGADAQQVLNNPGGYPASVITRDSTDALPGIPNSGTVLSVSAPYLNGPKTITNGMDLDVRFRGDPMTNGVRLTGGLNLSYINKFERTDAAGTTLNYAGTYGPTALSSSAGMPRTKASIDVTAAKGPWSVTTRLNYVSGIRVIESAEDPTCLGHNSSGNDFSADCRVPSFSTVDLYASYKVTNQWELSLGIRNLFDKLPAFDPQASYGLTHYNPSYALSGAIGRYFTLGAKYRFQ